MSTSEMAASKFMTRSCRFSPMILVINLLLSSYLIQGYRLYGSSIVVRPQISRDLSQPRKRMCLFMGRAAAVRAATKARTDGAKAKNNQRFAKKIIMAVKAGGCCILCS